MVGGTRIMQCNNKQPANFSHLHKLPLIFHGLLGQSCHPSFSSNYGHLYGSFGQLYDHTEQQYHLI